MKIGNVMKKFRKKAGMSQLALGIAIGNDAAYISRIENGQYEPTVKTIVKIAHALQVKPIVIFEEILTLYDS